MYVLFFIKHIPLSQFLHKLKVADRSSRLQNSALKPTLYQSFPPFVREQTKCISDILMIPVVTGNSTSRDLTNYNFGFGLRVQDFLLDFWLTSTSTNQLRVIKICQYQPAWDHQGVYHRRFDWGDQRQWPRQYKCRSQQIHSISVTQNC